MATKTHNLITAAIILSIILLRSAINTSHAIQQVHAQLCHYYHLPCTQWVNQTWTHHIN